MRSTLNRARKALTSEERSVLSEAVAIGLLGAWTHLSVHHVFDNLYVNMVDAGEAEATLLVEDQALTRFADSIIHQNVASHNARLAVRTRAGAT